MFDFLLITRFSVVVFILWRVFRNSTPKRQARHYRLSSEHFGQGRELPIKNPSTGEVTGHIRSYTPDEVQEAVRRARVAQREWAESTFSQRREVLRDLMHAIIENQDEIIRLSVIDSGKTYFEAEAGEILISCEKIRYLMKYGESNLARQYRRIPLALYFLKQAYVEYHPLGVIAAIVPYNYPFHHILSASISAIFAGNACVVKVSEAASGSKDFYEGLIRSVLAKRGWNPELVTVVPGYGDTGAAVVSSGVDKILFIGSPATGRRIMEAASKNLTPVILELGGKDPLIVYPDADIAHSIDIITRASLINCGQNCIAAERVYVHESIYDAVAERLKAKVEQLRVGPPCITNDASEMVDLGAITVPAQVEIVKRLVNDAVEKGAVVLVGGSETDCGFPGAHYFQPTLLGNVTHDMKIANEETFGPVLSLISFSNEEELFTMVNSTVYALGSTVFSNDLSRTDYLSKRICSEMMIFNDFGLGYLINDLPFGGRYDSGFGRFNGPEGLRDFSRTKSVIRDRFSFLKTTPPKVMQYPVPVNAVSFFKNAMTMCYGNGLSVRFRAGLRMVSIWWSGKTPESDLDPRTAKPVPRQQAKVAAVAAVAVVAAGSKGESPQSRSPRSRSPRRRTREAKLLAN